MSRLSQDEFDGQGMNALAHVMECGKFDCQECKEEFDQLYRKLAFPVVEEETEQRIVEFWYRGSLEIDLTQGNGRQTDLEREILEFEQWARS